jgi:hypothetical protein
LISEEEQADYFRECLRDPIREAYDLARTAIEDKATLEDDAEEFTFDKVVDLWLADYLDGDDYQEQLAYIKHVKKPNQMNGVALSIDMFYQRLRVIVKRMTYFPTAA